MPICKILIYLAVWKRPHITELCFVGIQRLKAHPDFEIDALAVISEGSMIPLCEKYGIKWVMTENEPLGRKKNFGLSACRAYHFDYLLEIGSDDLILNELLDSYKPYIGKWEIFGINDAAYIDSKTGLCRRLTSFNSTYGAGRMVSRETLEKVNFQLWNPTAQRGLDNNSLFALNRVGIKYHKVPPMEFPGVIDVKSETNIWGFNYFLGSEYDKGEIYSRISKREVELLESYVEQESAEA